MQRFLIDLYSEIKNCVTKTKTILRRSLQYVKSSDENLFRTMLFLVLLEEDKTDLRSIFAKL